jgi:hypothetical protein
MFLSCAAIITGAGTAAAAPAVGPTQCSAYVSGTNDHLAVGWCNLGNGTWYVQTNCATQQGGVEGPYKGIQGYRKLSTEKASTFNCGTGGIPVDLKVVDVKA